MTETKTLVTHLRTLTEAQRKELKAKPWLAWPTYSYTVTIAANSPSNLRKGRGE